jgi:hypothetical protein
MTLQIGDKIETHPQTWVEIKSIGTTTARVFQLDHNKNKIKLFRSDKHLEGVLTHTQPKSISL